MKIGVLTFHYSDNFGALLQCASLCEALRSIGHSPEVIDYRPPAHSNLHWYRHWGIRSRSPLSNAKTRISALLAQPRMKRRCEEFRRLHLNRSHRCASLPGLSKALSSFPAVVVGSDQVWNCRFPFVTPAYFLSDIGYNGRAISYAASCGSKELAIPHIHPGTAAALRRFDSISVRDTETAEFVQEISGREARIVLDPTLLCDLPRRSRPHAGDLLQSEYLVTYLWGKEISGGHQAAFDAIRARHGALPIVAIAPTSFIYSRHPYADRVVLDASPEDWVSLIAGARFVYTNSYHGTLFSIKHRRPFLTYTSEQYRQHRILDVAQRLGVESWAVGSVSEAKAKNAFETSPDFCHIHARLDHYRSQSLDFLQDALA